MTGISRTKYLGKHAFIFRFPGYEVMIVVNTKHSSKPITMEINQRRFTKEEVLIIDIDYNTTLDYQLVSNFLKCRDNTPELRRPAPRISGKASVY